MVDAPAQKGLSNKLDKKRKRQADDSTKKDKPETAPATSAPADGPSKKKRKQKKTKKQQAEHDARMQDRQDGIDQSIGKMDGRLLADYFVQRAKKVDKELSAVELSDMSVPGMGLNAIFMWMNIGTNKLQTTLSSTHLRSPRPDTWISFPSSSRHSVLRALTCQRLRRPRVPLIHWLWLVLDSELRMLSGKTMINHMLIRGQYES